MRERFSRFLTRSITSLMGRSKWEADKQQKILPDNLCESVSSHLGLVGIQNGHEDAAFSHKHRGGWGRWPHAYDSSDWMPHSPRLWMQDKGRIWRKRIWNILWFNFLCLNLVPPWISSKSLLKCHLMGPLSMFLKPHLHHPHLQSSALPVPLSPALVLPTPSPPH